MLASPETPFFSNDIIPPKMRFGVVITAFAAISSLVSAAPTKGALKEVSSEKFDFDLDSIIAKLETLNPTKRDIRKRDSSQFVNSLLELLQGSNLIDELFKQIVNSTENEETLSQSVVSAISRNKVNPDTIYDAMDDSDLFPQFYNYVLSDKEYSLCWF